MKVAAVDFRQGAWVASAETVEAEKLAAMAGSGLQEAAWAETVARAAAARAVGSAAAAKAVARDWCLSK